MIIIPRYSRLLRWIRRCVTSAYSNNIMLALLLAVAFSAQGAPDTPAWAGKLTDGTTTYVAVRPLAGERFAHLSGPKVVKTKEGTNVLAYIAGVLHGTNGGGSPAVSISKDGGKTFSEPKILRTFGKGEEYLQCGNLALGIADDDSIVLLAMAYSGREKNNIFGWRSIDDGATWAPVDTSTLGPNKTGSVFGRIVSVPNMGLVVLGHYRMGGGRKVTRGIWMAVSKDHGQTWGEPTQIIKVSAGEPTLVRTAKGRLIAMLRGTARSGQQYMAVSDDDGTTWKTDLSPLASENFTLYRLAAPFIAENPNKPNELIALTTERSKKEGTASRIWLWRADADKLHWMRDRVLVTIDKQKDIPYNDLGYPWMLHREGNKWTMYYYHGKGRGVNYIWAADVEI